MVLKFFYNKISWLVKIFLSVWIISKVFDWKVQRQQVEIERLKTQNERIWTMLKDSEELLTNLERNSLSLIKHVCNENESALCKNNNTGKISQLI